MTQDQETNSVEPAKSAKSKMFAVLQNPKGEPGVDQIMLIQANTRRDLAKALAEHPEMRLVVALRGKQLVAEEKRTVHFS